MDVEGVDHGPLRDRGRLEVQGEWKGGYGKPGKGLACAQERAPAGRLVPDSEVDKHAILPGTRFVDIMPE